MSSFADLLPKRAPVPFEEAGSFDAFRDAMIRSLTPFTPYECDIAENLISIEWELIQHRRMCEQAVREGFIRTLYNEIADDPDRFLEIVDDDSRTADNGSSIFDYYAAATDLIDRATASEPRVRQGARGQIQALYGEPTSLMSDAFAWAEQHKAIHDNKVRELERRRREVRSDFDALQKARPIEGEVIAQ